MVIENIHWELKKKIFSIRIHIFAIFRRINGINCDHMAWNVEKSDYQLSVDVLKIGLNLMNGFMAMVKWRRHFWNCKFVSNLGNI